MSFEFGSSIHVRLFGQSHAPAIGVVIDGLPAGFRPDLDALQAFLDRRAPGKSPLATARKEADRPEFLSGLVDGVTCGAPLCAVIHNTNQHSGDYAGLEDVPRPSHADYGAAVKYGAAHDIRGGGQFSGRLTAPLCIAGGLCLQLLKEQGVFVGAHIASIADVADDGFDGVSVDEATLTALTQKAFPVLRDEAGAAMQERILAAKAAGDSVGGIIECAAVGLPAGLGEPFFGSLEGKLAQSLFCVPAVKGLEFGAGFGGTAWPGSVHNDAYTMDGGAVRTKTNHNGGILGGMTTGMPVLFRVAVKPTPSIAQAQDSVSLSRREDTKLVIHGRHDPCIVPRAVPCIEAAAAIALYDLMK